MLARRDTRKEASRLRRLSPLQTLEDQSQTWGIRCHSCTGREGLSPSWKLSYKTEVLRFTREPRSSFNQRIARILMSHVMLGMSTDLPATLTRQRERRMQGCQSPGHVQRFLSAYGPIAHHFRLPRPLLSAAEDREEMRSRCARWAEVTGTERAASRAGRPGERHPLVC